MLWFKRVLCGIYALFLIVWGISLINDSRQLWLIIGCASFIGGLTLAHIAIKQTLPNYSFWITFVAICLGYALLVQNDIITVNKPVKVVAEDENVENPQKPVAEAVVKQPVKKKKKKVFNLSAYPRISGSITVIQANVFYVGGRYVRLYGVDAPDTDQLCSDINGSSYNCGEVAASWVRNWVDKNTVDCYLLKIDPNGQDLATCIWGKYDIGAALVGAGWAIANMRETNIYKPYEVQAKNNSSGLWQGSFYLPEDWRDIKRHRNDFTIKRKTSSGGDSSFFGSLFK